MNVEQIRSREEIIEQTKREDERSDLKQHADKMLRDFEKFNDYSSNRAIWELVQNACDLTTECEVEIDYKNNKISFSHNGKAFDTKSLISLIKQVSGKYGNQEDIPEVGKYGTGFLTTHSFGRKFILNSVIDAGGYYLPIVDFLIDRSPKTWEELSDNISTQKKKVFEILKSESSISNDNLKTTFTYLPETPKEFEYIEKSINDLDDYIPLVFAINERLKKLTIFNRDGYSIEYIFLKKCKLENDKGINLFQTIILKNKVETHVYSIIDEKDEIEIILPINREREVIEFKSHIARLFLYYPLIGSDDFGINFIINCKQFLPTEPRDGVHLNSDKDQIKEQEEKNRLIIDKSTDIIFSFLTSNVFEVSNPLFFTKVHFNTTSDNQLLNSYYEKLQVNWNERLKSLPFVKTIDGYKPIEDVHFFSDDFLNESEDIFDCFYEIIAKFYKTIPLKEDAVTWSNYAKNWNSELTNFISQKALLEKISNCGLQDFNKITLYNYYQHLISKGYLSVFNDYKLIPNIYGNFNNIGHFLLPENINDKLLDLGKILIPESITKLIHPDFTYNFILNSFNRRNFSDEVKNNLDQKGLSESIFFSECLNKEYYHSDLIEVKTKVDKLYFNALLDFCKLVNDIDSISKPNQLLKIISQYYNFDGNLLHLPNVKVETENVEYRSIRKVLVKIFLNIISLHNNNWVKNNLELLNQICALCDDSYKDVFKESKIYPNQLFELHLSENLNQDLGVKKVIKEFYLKVNKENIEEVLSITDFNHFIPTDNFINNRYLSTIIEDQFFNEDINNIEEHQHKEIILKIIPKLNDKEYQLLFPRLNDKKANIMISVVTKEETKDDIFAIVTLGNDKLKRIGKLVSNPNFEELLNKALEYFDDKKQTNANFQFKKQIGNHIEDILRNYLKETFKPEDIIAEVKEEQDGQDIIIKIKNEIKYYIEVKSRWDKSTSIIMSKNQTIRSYDQKDIYALCSVDMTNYVGEDRFEISDISKISENIKFVKDIGVHVSPLIEVLKQTNVQDEIHLEGDYKTLIPQKIIEDFGISLSKFEMYLINLLKN
jgi:hypothetical protein